MKFLENNYKTGNPQLFFNIINQTGHGIGYGSFFDEGAGFGYGVNYGYSNGGGQGNGYGYYPFNLIQYWEDL